MKHLVAVSLLGALLAGCVEPTSSNWSGRPDYIPTPNVVTVYPGWETPAPRVVQYRPGDYEFARDMMMLDVANQSAMELNGIRMGY